jgi:hypothetical protein
MAYRKRGDVRFQGTSPREHLFCLVRTAGYKLELNTIGRRKSEPGNIPRIAPSFIAFFQNISMNMTETKEDTARPLAEQEPQPRREALRFRVCKPDAVLK